MVEIPENFSSEKSETLCCCGDREIMSHIYYCEILSENRKQKTSYEKIYNGGNSEKTEVYKRFEENFKVRERIQNKCEITETASKVKQQRKIKKLPPCDPLVDPLV